MTASFQILTAVVTQMMQKMRKTKIYATSTWSVYRSSVLLTNYICHLRIIHTTYGLYVPFTKHPLTDCSCSMRIVHTFHGSSMRLTDV